MSERAKVRVEAGEDRIRIRVWQFNNNNQVSYLSLEYQNCDIKYSFYSPYKIKDIE